MEQSGQIIIIKFIKEDTLDYNGLSIMISGNPVKGDSFKLLATENLSKFSQV